MNYKLFKGKCVIQEENGKAKEINIFDDSLLFEGEYLNGKRNGKGREYLLESPSFSNSYFIFEGEYLNGKRHGKVNYMIVTIFCYTKENI